MSRRARKPVEPPAPPTPPAPAPADPRPFATRAELQHDLNHPHAQTRHDAAALLAHTYPLVEHALRRSIELMEAAGLTKNETYQTVKAAHNVLLKAAKERPWRK